MNHPFRFMTRAVSELVVPVRIEVKVGDEPRAGIPQIASHCYTAPRADRAKLQALADDKR